MINITESTNLIITEIKRGAAFGKSYEITAGRYIEIVRDTMDADGELKILSGIGQPDEDGDFEDYHDAFDNLPVAEQLERCIGRDEDRNATHITWEVAA